MLVIFSSTTDTMPTVIIHCTIEDASGFMASYNKCQINNYAPVIIHYDPITNVIRFNFDDNSIKDLKDKMDKFGVYNPNTGIIQLN